MIVPGLYLLMSSSLDHHTAGMVLSCLNRHIVGAVLEIWLLIFINVVLFAWMGVVLFSGTEEGTYIFPDIFEGSWNLFVLSTTTNFPAIM